MARFLFLWLMMLVHVSSFQILHPQSLSSFCTSPLNRMWHKEQHACQTPSHSKNLRMAVNSVGEINRRKLVGLVAFAVLTQLPTFQVGASESAGVNSVNGPEITAKVHRTLKHSFLSNQTFNVNFLFLRYISIYSYLVAPRL